jgi:hypothetical protein
MALLNMYSTQSPLGGPVTPGASPLVTYNTDAINWPTLASQSGIAAWSTFQYNFPTGAVGTANVKHTIAAIRTAASATNVS